MLQRKIKHPSNAKRVHVFDGNWHLYERPASSFLWVPFKLSNAALPRQWGRLRTFWLSWNPVDSRFAACNYTERLRTEQPALYEAVDLFMQINYDRAWLQETLGPTDADIAAERARLAANRTERSRQRAAGA